MAKIYGALEVAQLEWFTDAGKPAASSYIYRVIYVSDLKQVMVSDGTNWVPFLNTSTNQTLNGNITFAGEQIFNGLHRLSVTTDSSSTGAITALNNVTPVIEFTAAVTSISGIVNSASGATVMLVNRTGGTIAVLDEDTGATAANRIRTGTGAQITLANNASVLLTYVGDSRWHVIGGSGSGTGGGALNYITNGSAEADTLGWATYADAAGAAPVDGTGGTANVTFTRTTTTPLIGTASFLLSKDAVNRQGQGASYDFTIDSAYRAKVLQIDFEYQVASGTFVAGTATTDSDITVWIYDKTNNLLIQPSTYKLLSNSSSLSTKFSATFQSASNSTSYRLIFHVSTTSANAYSLEVDNISVAPEQYIYGTPVTDWQDYTLTIGATTTAPTQGSGAVKSARWRRVGDSMQLSFTYSQTAAGSAGSGTYLFPLPSGFSVDTTKATVASTTIGTTATNLGIGWLSTTTSSNTSTAGVGGIYAYNSTNLVITGPSTAAGTLNPVSSTYIALSNTNIYYSINAIIPISGWSSSVQTSDQTDTRVVAAQYTSNGNQSLTGDVTNITFSTLNYDTHGAWNGTTFTAPVSGYYQFQGMVFTGSVNIDLWLWKNGVKTFIATQNRGVTTSIHGFSGSLFLNSADTVTLKSDTNATLSASTSNHYININRLSGPSAIAASETVAASYWLSSNQSLTGGTTTINFDSKEFDSHGAVTTGSNWRFIAPIQGTYLVTAILNQASGAATYAHIYKNGTIYKGIGVYGNTSAATLIGGGTPIRLNAGDYIELRCSVSMTLQGGVLGATSVSSNISITRVGN